MEKQICKDCYGYVEESNSCLFDVDSFPKKVCNRFSIGQKGDKYGR